MKTGLAFSRSKLLKLPGAARFEPVPGRAMGEFVVIPPLLSRNRARLRACSRSR